MRDTTKLTKPLGCALQVLGANALVLGGLGLLSATEGGTGGLVAAVVFLPLAIWLLVVGRRPAVREANCPASALG